MKHLAKIAATVTALLVSSLMISCASTPLPEPLYTAGMIENATPENSVIVYGYSSEPGIKLLYVDEENGWEAIIDTDDREFALPPCHKGAKLVLKDSNWIKNSPGVVQYGNRVQAADYLEVYSGKNEEFNVTVPTDTPLYFMGCHSIMKSNMWSWESIVEMRNTPGIWVIGFPKSKEEWETWYPEIMTDLELDCLKKLQKTYKDTIWEEPINERMTIVSERLEELRKK